MGVEIERKFLVTGEPWRNAGEGVRIRQAYLCVGPPAAVRVRIVGLRATLNIKQATLDIARAEYEYPIPIEDARELLENLTVGHAIDKIRYRLPHAGRTWEIDVFEGANRGLVLAEVELQDPNEPLDPPSWVAQEVSGDPRYLNTWLSLHPYREWSHRP